MKTTIISAAALALLASAGSAVAQNNTKASPKVLSITATSFGTGAPPASLGGITMEKVPAGHACSGQPAGSLPSSFGAVTGAPTDGLGRCIGAGWATWSHGYTGDVWYTGGATSQTITLPAGVGAAYVYVEPNPFSVQTCSMTATGSSGSQSTGAFSADGSGGAVGWGFVESAGTLSSITVSCDTDFATGEWGVGGSAGPVCDFDKDGDYDRADLIFVLRQCLKSGTGGCIAQLLDVISRCGRP